jgi:hypothetical protein
MASGRLLSPYAALRLLNRVVLPRDQWGNSGKF